MPSSNKIEYYHNIYIEYAPMLIRFAEKFVSAGYAEDMVHDVFLKFWDKPAFDLPEKELKRVLFTSVRNICIDYLRRLNLETEIVNTKRIQLQIDELFYAENLENLYLQKDLVGILMKKIDELPEKGREIFKLAYIEGMKASEIAEEMGISVRTVETHLYRSLQYLRKHCSHLLSLLIANLFHL